MTSAIYKFLTFLLCLSVVTQVEAQTPLLTPHFSKY